MDNPLCRYGVCLLICGAVGTAAIFMTLGKHKYKANRAEVWEQSGDWKHVPCNVLSAGVACTEKDTGGTCGGYVAGKVDTSAPPYVFATEVAASCPGVYWCAKEGTECHCDGDITYAPRIFNGAAVDPYNVDAALDPAFTIVSDGSAIMCDSQPRGPFPRDPAPGWTKQCFCTPSAIKSISRGGFDKQECALRSNTEFENWEADADTSQVERRLASPRRRRTYSYTPWALVELSTTVGIPSPSPPAKQVACAYEFGNSLASYEDYQSDGPYKQDVWTVEDLVKEWSESGSRQCYVRVAGEAEQAGQVCTIAMSKPGSLEEKRRANASEYKAWLLWLSIPVFVIGLCIFVVPAILTFMGYETTRSDTGAYESANQPSE